MRRTNQYDYIVAGAGSAGCVLAARLTEDPGVRVLVIEAGGWDRDPLIHIPVGIGKIGLGKSKKGHKHDWGYRTEPEPDANNRRIEARRGKVIGGSSSVNVMAYVRGNRADYDRWARNGATGWSYADVLAYFKRCETFEGGADAWRGGSGPLGVTFAKTPDPLFPAIVEAGRQAGFPSTPDYNGESQEGFGRSQMTIWRGRRSSAAVAFLHPALRRTNLTVVTGALATRVLLDKGRAIGLQYRSGGETIEARAEREVILSGGVFNSPQLLMLSGIGRADHLSDLGIEPIVDLPGVGQNLQDHPAVTLRWSRPNPGPFHGEMRADRMVLNILRGFIFRSGPATYLPGGTFAFIKTRPDVEAPDIQYLCPASPEDVHLWFPPIKAAYADGFGFRPCLMRPYSRGEIKLRSNDPAAPIRIHQNFLQDRRDLETLRDGCKRARDVAGQPALDAYRGLELTPGPDVKTDAQMEEWIRRTVTTASHPCGTCAMGSSDNSVLDPQMRVRGVDGLRVVDASAMPDVVSGNINACVLMMAEKASDMIRGLPPLTCDVRATGAATPAKEQSEPVVALRSSTQGAT